MGAISKRSKIADGLQFVRDSRKEMLKVAWPDRKEATAVTILVIALTFLAGFYLAFVDFVLSEIVKSLIR